MTDEEARALRAARTALEAAENALRMGRGRAESNARRLRRYAYNARVEASLAIWRAAQDRRGASLTENAAVTQRERYGDEKAALLYEEMAGAFLDAAEAHEDFSKAAAKLAEHFAAQVSPPEAR